MFQRGEYQRIEAVCRTYGAQLVVVAKGQPKTVWQQLIEDGVQSIGLSRREELRVFQQLQQSDDVELHAIGHLQRQGLSTALKGVHLIHSLDRMQVLDRIQRLGEHEGRVFRGLLQVNVARDGDKGGFMPEDTESVLAQVTAYPSLRIEGLMTIGRLDADDVMRRNEFAQLRQLRDQLQQSYPSLQELSMGMSADYQLALEEGATIIRVGSRLFVS